MTPNKKKRREPSDEADGPLKLPTASELALLAACLPSEKDVEKALEKGLVIYLRASAYLAEIATQPMADIISGLGDDCLFSRFVLQPAQLASRLRLDVASSTSDEVREYLNKKNLPLKTATSVLKNLRKFFVARAETQGKSSLEGESRYQAFLSDHAEDGKKAYLVPISMLDLLVRWKKQKKAEGVRRGHVTRRNRVAPRTSTNTVK